MNRRHLGRLAALSLALLATTAPLRAEEGGVLRIGYQRSSTLVALLRQDEGLEKALAPLKVTVSWHKIGRASCRERV